jgi:hypothetical protein
MAAISQISFLIEHVNDLYFESTCYPTNEARDCGIPVNRHAVNVLYLMNGTHVQFIHPLYDLEYIYLGYNCHCCWYLGASQTVAK